MTDEDLPWFSHDDEGDSVAVPDDLFVVEPIGVVEWIHLEGDASRPTTSPEDGDGDEDDAERVEVGDTDSEPVDKDSAKSLGRAVSKMALGTALSRLSGLLRILVLAYALGLTPLADAFNLANTVPNMVFDLVLGGVISATFVPVFIAQLETQKKRDAWASISAVLSVSVVILGLATVICVALAPLIIDGFTGLHSDHTLALESQRHTATVLLRWFVPQIFFYGLIALATALLNVHRIFAPPMWVAIANNVVCIGVLVAFAAGGPAPSLAELSSDPSRVTLLGLGSTAGVIVQALLLLPFLARAEVRRLWWNFDLRDRAIRAAAKLGTWTLGLVVCNQVALFIILALAFGLGGTGQVSAYSYAWIFFQTPYAVISISIMSAMTPALSTAYAKDDPVAWRGQFGRSLRQMLVLVIPLSMLLFILAKPLMELLFSINGGVSDQTTMAGHALAGFALGLPGFCAFQFVIRAMQTRHGGHHAFWLYVAENGLTILLALGLVGPLGVTGLALSNSIAYSLTALAGLWWIKHLAGGIGDKANFRPLVRVSVSSLIMGVAVLVGVNVSASTTVAGLIARLILAGVVGGATYWVCLVAFARPRKTRA